MKKILLFMAVFWQVMAAPAHADEAWLQAFKSIPVMHEGRLKPLDTYARNLLLQFSGRDSYEGMDASAWLAELLFIPQKTFDDKVILINDPEIATALGIKAEMHRRYSFNELKAGFNQLQRLSVDAAKIDAHERSLTEGEIIRVEENAATYTDLASEFLWAVPHADFTISSAATKRTLGLPLSRNEFSFIDIALRADKIKGMLIGLKAKKPQDYSADEQELMAVVSNMFHWAQSVQDMPLAIIPLNEGSQWVSPWDALADGFSDDQVREFLVILSRMAESYQEGNKAQFDHLCRVYIQSVGGSINRDEIKAIHKFPLELLYHRAEPFMWPRVFYILAFIFFIISFSSTRPIWYWLGLFSIVAGIVPHGLGLLARIIIMDHPPVTNLYETFIFVSFITVFLGLCIEHFNRQWLGIMISAISGTVLLFIADRYSAEGDTLKMLVAVLNSNFWLGTHVTTITMGYGATCVAGILGHIWLVQAMLGKKSQVLDTTYKTTLGIMGVALTLAFLGTNLGGIWADQSWGRFWGWDPKENGALMIVLWLAILFHAKFGKMIGPRGLAVGCVVALMVVMWAWFGVNLLSIGLHSYGFTSGIANALITYAVVEVVFILLSLVLTRNFKA